MSTTVAVSVTTQKVTEFVTIQPLTTTFTPPASCGGKHLSQMSSPGYNIWLDEPNPVPNTIIGGCYPPEFMDGYTSVYNASSSVAVYFSPLVCPQGWHTATIATNGYIACCASGYLLAPPSTTVDTNRPAYGGTCYSDIKIGSTITVTQYDSVDVTGTASFAFPTSAQAYAHPIDGFMEEVVSTSSQISVPSSTWSLPTSTASSTGIPGAGASPPSSQLSGGAIAGIIIGVIAVLVGLLAAVFFLMRRRKNAAVTPMPYDSHHQNPFTYNQKHGNEGSGTIKDTAYYHSKSAGVTPTTTHAGLFSPPESVVTWTTGRTAGNYSPPNRHGNVYMPNHPNQYELDGTYQTSEMDSGYKGHEMRG